MSKTGDDQYIKEIVRSTVEKCGACGREYASDNVSVLGHEEELWFLMIVCNGCHSRGLVAALIKDRKRAKVVGELIESPSEPTVAGVTPDDVAAMREFLADFNGDFRSLFEKKSE